VVVSWVSTPVATWTTLLLLLSIHLATNYAAVTSVSMRSLNRQRANIVLSRVLHSDVVLQPTQVSRLERVFERDGALRWVDGDRIIGYCHIGVTLSTILQRVSTRHSLTGSLDMQAIKMSDLMQVFVDEAYVLWFSNELVAWIALKEDATPNDQLRAWMHALLLAHRMRAKAADGKRGEDDDDGDDTSASDPLAELRLTLAEVRAKYDASVGRLREAGWDLDIAALETKTGTRMKVEQV
jgi:hypothetical protein